MSRRNARPRDAAVARVEVLAMSAALPVELDDIQGLVRFGYKHHTEASFLLLRVHRPRRGAALARGGAGLHARRRSSRRPRPPCRSRSAATACAPSASPTRSSTRSPPSSSPAWRTTPTARAASATSAATIRAAGNGAPATRVPHVLVLLYALPGQLAGFQSAIEAQCAAGFEKMDCLTTSDLDGIEPFGFTDGISQPLVDWQRKRAAQDAERKDYSNLSCLGEYLLGYPNEYGGYTDRPLLDPALAGTRLPRAEDAPDRADLGRNGSYLVMRQLRQDVHGFWQFVDRQAGGDAGRRETIASAMVGRRRDGVPLVGPADETIEGGGAPGDLNAFTYRSDRDGLRCPLGAHIRRSNPRNADLPPGAPGLVSWAKRTLGFDADALAHDLVASTRFHRLLRRGREYGTGVAPEQALGDGLRRRRHGAALHLPRRQHRAPVRVRAERLGDGGSLRRPAERERSAARHARAGGRRHADRRLLDAARRRRRRADHRPAAVRHRARRRATSSCPASAPCASWPARHEPRTAHHELEPEPTGPARQYRLEAARLHLRHGARVHPASSAASIRSSGRRSTPCCAIRWRASSPS